MQGIITVLVNCVQTTCIVNINFWICTAQFNINFKYVTVVMQVKWHYLQ